jgi:hypothetical protein
MVLHAAKYPQRAVNGILLASKPKAKESKTVSIVDCIPLFHLNLNLTPMLEVALTQVECYGIEVGQTICGYYQANENFRDNSPDFIATRVMEKVYESFPEGCLIMLDNRKITLGCRGTSFEMYQLQDGKFKVVDRANIHLEQGQKTYQVTSSLMQSKLHRELVDFDNHLDNIALDWRNIDLNEEVSQQLA